MGFVKGNPVMLVTLFFGAAVLSMGGAYAVVKSFLDHPSLGYAVVLIALCISLGLSLLIIGRIFWVVSRGSGKSAAANARENPD